MRSSQQHQRLAQDDFDDEYEEDDNPRRALADEESYEDGVTNPLSWKDGGKMAPMSIETGREGRKRGFAFPGRRQLCDQHPKATICCLWLFVAITVGMATGFALPLAWLKDEYRKVTMTKSTLLKFQNFSAVGAFYEAVSAKDAVVESFFGEVTKVTKDQGGYAHPLEKDVEHQINNGYPNVIYDDDTWRLYYGACERRDETKKVPGICDRQILLYAESEDGGFETPWTKPPEYSFLMENSSVLTTAYGVGVTYAKNKLWAVGEICVDKGDDDDESSSSAELDCEKERTVKNGCDCLRDDQVVKNVVELSAKEGAAVVDPDAVRLDESSHPLTQWSLVNVWDTHNNIVYDPVRKVYVGTTRIFDAAYGRQVAIAVAKQKVSTFWETLTVPVVVLQGTPTKQYYSMVTFPWRDVLLGLVGEFHPGQTFGGVVRCRLAYSPKPRPTAKDEDSQWAIIGDDDFIPLGPAGAFDSHVIFAARPVEFDGSARVYYFGGDAPHNDPQRNSTLGLATVDPSRYAGIRLKPDQHNSTVVTSHAVRCSGPFLALTFDVASDGACFSLTNVQDRNQKQVVSQKKSWTFCGAGTFTDRVVDDLDLSAFKDQDLLLSFDLAPDVLFYGFSFLSTKKPDDDKKPAP